MMMYINLATLNIFSNAFHQSDPIGKLIFIGLFMLSIVSWIVLLYKIRNLREAKKRSLIFLEELQNNKDRLLFFEPHEKLSPYSHLFFSYRAKTRELLEKNHSYLEETFLTENDIDMIYSFAQTAISSQLKSLEKHLFILPTVITLAPFLGLLGTVWGILVTFGGLEKGGISSNAAVLGGLSTALATTVLGLVIAIPAVIGFNYLKSNLKHFSSDLEDFLTKTLSLIEIQYRRVEK